MRTRTTSLGLLLTRKHNTNAMYNEDDMLKHEDKEQLNKLHDVLPDAHSTRDFYFTATLLALSNTDVEIRLVGLMPCETHGDRGSNRGRRRYNMLLTAQDNTNPERTSANIISSLREHYDGRLILVEPGAMVSALSRLRSRIEDENKLLEK